MAQISWVDVFLFVGLLAAFIAALSLRELKPRILTPLIVALGFFLLSQYQNCTPVTSNTLGSNSTNNPSPGGGPLTYSMTAPTDGSTFSAYTNLTVSGNCTYSTIQMSFFVSIGQSGATKVGPLMTGCQLGSSGAQWQVTFAVNQNWKDASQNPMVVPSLGVYQVTVQAFAPGQMLPTYSRNVTFQQGLTPPQITTATLSEQPSTSLVTITGTCDQYTATIELFRSYNGPVTNPSGVDNFISVNTGGFIYDVLCNQSTHTFTIQDPRPALAADLKYYVVSHGNGATSSPSGKISVFARNLPKNINDDDAGLILYSLVKLLNPTTLTMSQILTYGTTPYSIFTRLRAPGSTGSPDKYGIYGAACSIVMQDSGLSTTYTDPTSRKNYILGKLGYDSGSGYTACTSGVSCGYPLVYSTLNGMITANNPSNLGNLGTFLPSQSADVNNVDALWFQTGDCDNGTH